MSTFAAIQWVLTVATLLLLIAIYRYRRYLFVKPSVLLVAYTHLFFQWPAALQSDHFEASLPDPYVLILAIHGFALCGLAVAATTHHDRAIAVWNRLGAPLDPDSDHVATRAMWMLGVFAAVIVLVYLSVVPFSETGLYMILNNPALAALARENSLKLLDNRVVAYLYTIMASAAAPLLAVMLAVRTAERSRRRRFAAALVCVVGIMALIVASSLSGARGYSVNLIFALGLAAAFRHRLPFHPLRYLGVLLLVLAPAVLLSLLRENKLGDVAEVGQVFVSAIFERAFVGPLEVGTWYVRHMQLHGAFGVAAVPRLASLVGVPAVDAPNLIGLLYAPYETSILSISAGAGFTLTYIGYFGPLALFLNLILLWLMDVVLFAYDWLPDALLLPCVAAMSLATLNFISADYTVGWMTHGFGTIVVLALIVGWLARQGVSARGPVTRVSGSGPAWRSAT